MAQTKEVSELFLRYPTQNFADTLTAQTTSLAQINTATPIVIGSHGTSAIEFINRQMQKISGVLFEDGGEIFEQAAVNGILSYAWANYEEQANVAGYGVGSKYDADTLGLQLMGGLDLAVSGFTLTPEAGLRYYHIGRDSYTNSMGSSVADSDEDVLTGVIGARFAKAFEVSPAMSVVPQVRLAMTYDIVDADNTSFVTLANGSSYSVDGETLDRFGVEADIGVKAEMGDNFEMSLSYEGAWRGDYQNHAGILNAKYKF